MLTPFAPARRRSEVDSLQPRQLGLALLSGLFLAVDFASWITSLAYTSVASSVVLVSTIPLWVALLSPLVLKESISRPVIYGMLLALVGGVVVGLSDTCALPMPGWPAHPLASLCVAGLSWATCWPWSERSPALATCS